MSTSQGLGRRRPPLLALAPWKGVFDVGALGEQAGRAMAQELYFGGHPLPPVEIPLSWLRGQVRLRQSNKLNRAEVALTGGATARSSNLASPTEQQWVFRATLDSIVGADPGNLAKWVTDYYTTPLPRSPAYSLILNTRTEAEIWRILGVTQGRRISIVDTPTGLRTTVTDAFGRTASNGWGSADTGQPWSVFGGATSEHLVAGGIGQQSHTSVNAIRGALLDTGATDMTLSTAVEIPVNAAAGAVISQWVCVRATDSSNYYVARLDVDTAGAVTLTLLRRVAGVLSGPLVSGVTVGTGHAAGSWWRVTVDIAGSTLRAKAWPGDVEPDWQVTATDATLTAGTSVGLLSRLETGNVDAVPVVVGWDNASVTVPYDDGTIWPDGATELTVEGITHQISGDLRTVTWNTAPVIGSTAGASGPWLRWDDSRYSSSTDKLPF